MIGIPAFAPHEVDVTRTRRITISSNVTSNAYLLEVLVRAFKCSLGVNFEAVDARFRRFVTLYTLSYALRLPSYATRLGRLRVLVTSRRVIHWIDLTLRVIT